MAGMRALTAAGALLAMAAAGCTAASAGDAGGADEPGTKAGGSAAVVTVRVATADPPGRPGVAQIEEFARQVDTLSDGTIRVEPVPQPDDPGGSASDWDQEIARLVSSGEVEMGLVPSRAWASLGVSSLQALTAPFLITDQAVLSTVVSGEMVDPLLSGLDAAGVQGLGLWPEGLRRPFSFGDPLLGPEDYAGVAVRAPAAVTTEAMFAALGATTDDWNGPDFTTGVADGTVDAAESSFAWATKGLPAASVATGNVAFFPKVNVLVIDEEAAAELGEDRVGTLREAAEATTRWALSQQQDESEAARAFCEAGGTVVLASEAQADGVRTAVAAVSADLAQDALTAELIEKIEQIPTTGPAAISPCAPASAAAADTEAVGPPVVADGVYRYDIPLQYLLDGGIPQSQARADAGVTTVTMQDGVYTEQWRNDVVGDKTCTGTYVVAGDRMFMTWTPGAGCEGAWSARATVDGDTITWNDIQAIPPDSPEYTSEWEVYLGVPWTRIGEAPQ